MWIFEDVRIAQTNPTLMFFFKLKCPNTAETASFCEMQCQCRVIVMIFQFVQFLLIWIHSRLGNNKISVVVLALILTTSFELFLHKFTIRTEIWCTVFMSHSKWHVVLALKQQKKKFKFVSMLWEIYLLDHLKHQDGKHVAEEIKQFILL